MTLRPIVVVMVIEEVIWTLEAIREVPKSFLGLVFVSIFTTGL